MHSDSLENLTNDAMVIEEAEAITGLSMAQEVGTKFADKLSAALYYLSLDGFSDDIANCDSGDYVERIGRYILLCDSQGFVNTRTYADVYQAHTAFTFLLRDMGF
jgi:hypothetical protein